jgi:hypothetical protein
VSFSEVFLVFQLFDSFKSSSKCVRRPCQRYNSACISQPKYLTLKNVTLLLSSKDIKRGVVLHNIDTSKSKTPLTFEMMQVRFIEPEVFYGMEAVMDVFE